MRTWSPGEAHRVPRFSAVCRYLGQVFLASIAVAAAAVLVVPKVLGWDGMLVLTGSMEPALEAGGVAFVDRVPADDMRVGDIMTFTRAGTRQHVTHRVTAVVPGGEAGPRFLTEGDANDGPDIWTVTPKQVVGKVRYALPNLGPVGRMLVEDRHVLALLMALAAACLLAEEFRRSRRQSAEVRRWLKEQASRVPIIDEPLPRVPPERPRRTRKVLVDA